VGRIRENKNSLKHLVARAGVPSFNNASSHFYFSFGFSHDTRRVSCETKMKVIIYFSAPEVYIG
jgi:hypothetical protein